MKKYILATLALSVVVSCFAAVNTSTAKNASFNSPNPQLQQQWQGLKQEQKQDWKQQKTQWHEQKQEKKQDWKQQKTQWQGLKQEKKQDWKQHKTQWQQQKQEK